MSGQAAMGSDWSPLLGIAMAVVLALVMFEGDPTAPFRWIRKVKWPWKR